MSNPVNIFFSGDALIEVGDDPEVIRAKYFIRDEFLVSFFCKVCAKPVIFSWWYLTPMSHTKKNVFRAPVSTPLEFEGKAGGFTRKCFVQSTCQEKPWDSLR